MNENDAGGTASDSGGIGVRVRLRKRFWKAAEPRYIGETTAEPA
jgi:hypothetical protein